MARRRARAGRAHPGAAAAGHVDGNHVARAQRLGRAAGRRSRERAGAVGAAAVPGGLARARGRGAGQRATAGVAGDLSRSASPAALLARQAPVAARPAGLRGLPRARAAVDVVARQPDPHRAGLSRLPRDRPHAAREGRARGGAARALRRLPRGLPGGRAAGGAGGDSRAQPQVPAPGPRREGHGLRGLSRRSAGRARGAG